MTVACLSNEQTGVLRIRNERLVVSGTRITDSKIAEYESSHERISVISRTRSGSLSSDNKSDCLT